MFLNIYLIVALINFSAAIKYSVDNRPRIESSGGNLVIRAAYSKDISILTSGNGNLLLNGANLTTVLKLAQKSSDALSKYKKDMDTITTEMHDLYVFSSQMNDFKKRLEVLERNGTNGTSPIQLRMLLNLRRMTNRLVRRFRTLFNLLTLNECASNPCLNGGTCQDMYNAFICQCPNTWEGLRCDEDVNECSWYSGTELGCQNGARCINKPGSYECVCTDGWYGIHCTKRLQDCSSGIEMCGHGTCVSQSIGVGFKCICDQGWTTDGSKPACTVDVNECESYKPPCSINPSVKCINLPGTFHCANCPNGYSGNGFYCSDIDECAIFNGGCSINPMVQCINTPGSKTCGSCPPGYIGNGITCTYQGGVCGVNNGGCHHSAQCRDNPRISSSYVECTCPVGYVGTGVGVNGCTKGNDPCIPSPCIHGLCSKTVGGDSYVCSCFARFTGTNCEIRKSACDSNPCQNGGRCVKLFFSYKCVCPSTYTGLNCQDEAESCGRRIISSLPGNVSFPLNRLTGRKMSCAWVVETDSDKVLSINYNLTNFENCARTWVQINDGSTTASNLIGRFCGNKSIAGNFTTTSHTVYIWYRSDFNTNIPTINFSWNSTDPICGGQVDVKSHGSFKSPGAPGNYPNNRDCYWKFIAPLGKRIQFHFFSMMIGFNKDCNNDYLEFINGLELNDASIIKYCNTSHPDPLFSPGNEVMAHFHSNENGNFPGFQITYSVVEGIPGCGGIYSTSKGEISSPSSNGKYAPNTLCEYKIKVSGVSKVKITFESISVEKSDFCNFDYLAFYDGGSIDSPLIGKYCGTKNPSPIISMGTEILVVFKTDWTNEDVGFKIKYETICGGKYIDSSATIQSSNYPNVQKVNEILECTYEIVQPEGSTIFLNVTDIDFGSGAVNCSNGYLEIRDGDNENSTLVGKYCDKAPETIISTYNYLWVKYYVSYASLKGFQIVYNVMKNNGCGGILKTKLGSVESPENLDTFTQGLKCTWLIIAPEDSVVQITWVRFNMEQSYSCTYDKVMIIDNGTIPGNSMGTFCGNKLPPTLISSSNKVTAILSVDASNNLDGFLFTYNFIQERNVCGGRYYTTSGVVKSPHYPDKYPINRDCVWVITVPTGQQLLLNITFFEIEKYFNCRYDFLEIRNGGTSASPLIGKYCGTIIPKRIPSHANQLYLHFKSDMTKTAPGFYITWDSTSTGCGGSLSSPTGTIISPHYPEPYDKNTECYWQIAINAGSVIQIVFADLDLEARGNCILDYVEIDDIINNQLGSTKKSFGKFCSSEIGLPPFLRSSSNHMTIKFRSDPSYQGRGFQLKYTSICNTTLTGFFGVIESPNFPNAYPRDQHCKWEIQVAHGNKINITFSHFEFEPENNKQDNCTYDYLQVRYEDPEDEGSLLTYGTYCHFKPSDMTINSNKAEILFVSDTTFSLSGFRLEWSIEGCGGILTHPSGNIKTPNYPNGYPTDTHCDWVIQTDFGKSVEITFKNIDLEHSVDCSYDYIMLFNGADDTSPMISKFCKVENPITLTSVGNLLLVRFVSDMSYKGIGFTANYTTVPIKCGGNLSSSYGIFHSPNYPKNYDKNDSCAWLITVNENHKIDLTFQDVDLLKYCQKNYIKVYDGPSAAYPVLTTICGSKAPNNSIESSTNHLYVEMVTNSYITTKGFKATYKTACGATIKTQGSGLLSYSPFIIPDEYGDYVNCSYTISSVRPDEHIFLTFTYLNAKYCDIGVNVYSGTTNEAPLIGHYCGTKIPPLIKSSGSVMHIEFDPSHKFEAKYSVADTTCGGTLESEKGLIASPNYPSNYPINSQCEWTLKVSPGNRASLIFSKFDMVESPNCNQDYMEIREQDFRGKLLGVFCGNNVPSNISAENGLWIFFRTGDGVIGDNTITATGFMAQYILVHGVDLTGPTGQIASPFYPRIYDTSTDHTWRITVKPEYQISIKFIDFTSDYLEYMECTMTYLTIYDGYDDTSPIITTLCGLEIPKPIKTKSNVVYIKLQMEMVRKGTKFLLEWQEIRNIPTIIPPNSIRKYYNCGSNETIPITSEKYNLTSPNYPTPYNNVMICTWIFSTTSDKHLAIRFTAIDLRAVVPGIYGDTVKIYSGIDGTNLFKETKAVYLANNTGIPFETSNVMKVIFKSVYSHVSQNKTGFYAVVSEVCGGTLTATNGVIQMNNNTIYNLDETPIQCEWNISVRSGKTIQIKFSEFHLGENCKNYLLLKNGQYPNSPILGNGKYCGVELPADLETTGNYLHIKYFSYSTITNFKLEYTEKSISCGGDILLTPEEPFINISSPNFPNIPPTHTECIWRITVPNGEAVMIDFLERFDLTTSKDCITEYVELRNGGTKASPLIGKYCNEIPSTQKSFNNMMYVKFFTDTDDPSNGFKAKLSIATCGGTIRWENGEIKSPGFNVKRNYPINADCKWSLIGTRDHYLILDFLKLDLPSRFNQNCTNIDHVTITELNKVNNTEIELGTYCGRKPITNIISSSNEVYVYFKTDKKSKLFNGFNLYFNTSQEKCGGTLSAESGVITSPGYPVMDHYNRNCEWTIRVPKGRRVKILIEDLDFDKTIDFYAQGIAFYSGEDFSSFINYLKAEDTTREIYSSDNVMKIFFWSHSSSHRGFKATYSSDEPTVCLGSFNEVSGIITTPNASTFRCNWIHEIVPNDVHTLSLSFDVDVKNPTSSCLHGFSAINVYLGDDKTSTAELCKATKHTTIIRSLNQKLRLMALHSKSADGMNFTMRYQRYQCGGIIENQLGYLTSPNYPNKPTQKLECAWLLKSSKDQTISIKVAKINLGSDCDQQFIEIYNGKSKKSPKIIKLCGSQNSVNIQSQDNYLWLEYHYDPSSTGTGFNLTYEPIVKGCGGILQSDTAILETPFYPKDYPKNSECLWELRAKSGYHINIEFIDRFQIETSDNCANDYIKMYNLPVEESNSSIQKYCGRQLPIGFNSTGNIMYLLFRSNDKLSGAGFRARLNLQCGGTFYAKDYTQYLVSPGYPENYGNQLNCRYKIISQNNYISLDFQEFELERGFGCNYDNLTVLTKTISRNSRGLTFCGVNKPPLIRQLDSVELVFTTDKWITRKGFVIAYKNDVCGGPITKPTSIETSTQKVSNYNLFEGKRTCVWNITAPANKRVSIRFTNITLLFSVYCGLQNIKLSDEFGKLAILCGEIDGDNLPTVHSNSNFVQIIFSHSMYLYKSWFFSALVLFNDGPSAGCGGNLQFLEKGQQKEIQTPQVITGFDCIWSFNTNKSNTIKIEIIENYPETCAYDTGTDGCSCLSYEFRDGPTSNSELIAKYCSNSNIGSNPTYYTSREYLFIRIAGNKRVSKPAKIRVSAEISVCGTLNNVATKTAKYITTPNYPSQYPANIKCLWKIKSSIDKIQIRLVEFNLNKGTNDTTDSCQNRNSLEIADKSAHGFSLDSNVISMKKLSSHILSSFDMMLGTHSFCNPNDEGYEYYSTSSDVQLKFNSNGLLNKDKGFKLEYKLAISDRNYTDLQGRIIKTWHIGNCSIFIKVPQNYTISIYFLYFNTMFSNCDKSKFEIYDGNRTSNMLLQLCQRSLPSPVFSTGNQVLINIGATVRYAANSYDIVYTSTTAGRGCGGDLYNFKGAISSPLYPGAYTNDTLCTWNIKVPMGLKVAFKFKFFDMQGSCESNYITIITQVDNDNNEHRFCKGDKPAVLISNSKLIVRYKTSASNAGTGWMAKFMAITSDIDATSLNY